jgi:hypothetical protein
MGEGWVIDLDRLVGVEADIPGGFSSGGAGGEEIAADPVTDVLEWEDSGGLAVEDLNQEHAFGGRQDRTHTERGVGGEQMFHHRFRQELGGMLAGQPAEVATAAAGAGVLGMFAGQLGEGLRRGKVAADRGAQGAGAIEHLAASGFGGGGGELELDQGGMDRFRGAVAFGFEGVMGSEFGFRDRDVGQEFGAQGVFEARGDQGFPSVEQIGLSIEPGALGFGEQLFPADQTLEEDIGGDRRRVAGAFGLELIEGDDGIADACQFMGRERLAEDGGGGIVVARREDGEEGDGEGGKGEDGGPPGRGDPWHGCLGKGPGTPGHDAYPPPYSERMRMLRGVT